MKTRFYLLILALVMVSCAGQNTAADNQSSLSSESTQAQCQRFNAGLTSFNERFTARENDRDSQQAIVENLVAVFDQEIQQLEEQSFADTTLQALYQQALGSIIFTRDSMVDYLEATERGDQAAAETAYGNMQVMSYEISEVVGQFEQYCGSQQVNEDSPSSGLTGGSLTSP
ncbi:hypothetical protein [Nodosilinea sp. E11]|uniref:hypothetical protein n=1 Tax=Nodosilinea sp. E11 TaxID=3037479 RepID=UPI0029347A33|nr:hypothetical protein [Nodosilinea sp. E11]WOD40682.1 hypothetical protein RRF56_07730 [Nodosilinea sp. E11]